MPNEIALRVDGSPDVQQHSTPGLLSGIANFGGHPRQCLEAAGTQS